MVSVLVFVVVGCRSAEQWKRDVFEFIKDAVSLSFFVFVPLSLFSSYIDGLFFLYFF